MKQREIKDLQRKAKGPSNNVTRRLGTVETTGPLTVSLGGSDGTFEARRLASYTPTVGHLVAVDVFGRDLLVLGQVV